jgi:hypothetical protein
MINRCEQTQPKKDNLLLIEGAEGEGKTNDSVAVAYYVKSKTNREIHLFFSLNNLINFSKNTQDKIIIWDEPALDALGSDWYKETNKDLIRLLMTIRKNRHFFIFNLTKFFKFQEYIVVDRGMGMIHVYSRKEIVTGRFVYIKKRNLERLYTGYRFQKKRLYGKLKSFGGAFPEVLEKHFDKMNICVENIPNASYRDYLSMKDKALQRIGTNGTKKNKFKVLYENLKSKVGNFEFPIKNKQELAERLGISLQSLYNWAKKEENPIENEDFQDSNIKI